VGRIARQDLYVLRLAAIGLVVLVGGAWLVPVLVTAAGQDGSPASGASDRERGWVFVEPRRVSLADAGLDRVEVSPEAATPLGDPDETTVLNIWASSCGPCRSEIPLLQQLHADGVRVLGVSRDRDRGEARELAEELGVTYPNWLDPDGDFVVQLQGLVPLNAYPSTVVLRGDRVVAVKSGEIRTAGEVLRVLDEVGAGDGS
jgi:thiol-disulfide isomerase/thioredoxin